LARHVIGETHTGKRGNDLIATEAWENASTSNSLITVTNRNHYMMAASHCDRRRYVREIHYKDQRRRMLTDAAPRIRGSDDECA